MKKIMTFVLVLMSMLLCCGCMGSIQIEDRNYVMAMGIDYDEAEGYYAVTLSFPDLKALTGDGMDLHYPVMEIQGRNLKDIEDTYHQEANKRLDFGQLQTIVFGETVLKNEAALEVLISYMKNNQTFTRTILVCAADRASEIVALDTSVNGSIGIYIRNMFENNGANGGMALVNLNDMIIAKENKGMTVELPYLRTDGEIPWYEDCISTILDTDL